MNYFSSPPEFHLFYSWTASYASLARGYLYHTAIQYFHEFCHSNPEKLNRSVTNLLRVGEEVQKREREKEKMGNNSREFLKYPSSPMVLRSHGNFKSLSLNNGA